MLLNGPALRMPGVNCLFNMSLLIVTGFVCGITVAGADDLDGGWVVAGIGSGDDWYSSASFPMPGECTTPLVCDEGQLLSSSVVHQLHNRIANLARNGSLHPCGAAGPKPFQFAVVTLARLAAAETMKTFTEGVFNKWGIGHRECNDGVLLALSRDDRKNYIKTGAGAKGILLDNHAAEILASLKPYLRNGNYDAALALAVKRVIEEALEPGHPPMFYRLDRATFGFLHILHMWVSTHWRALGILVALTIFLVNQICAAAERSQRRQEEFERKLRRLEEAKLKLSKRDGHGSCVDAPCPICFEDLGLPESSKRIQGPRTVGKPPAVRSVVAKLFQDRNVKHGAELLRCGHVFHVACISKWLDSSLDNSCPVCRTSAPRSGQARTSKSRDRREAPADVDNAFWASALDNLSAEYEDVEGVSRMRRLQRGRGAAAADGGEVSDSEDLWTDQYEESVKQEKRERAAELDRRRESRTTTTQGESGGTSQSDERDDDWGGGNCNGGGGAGGDW